MNFLFDLVRRHASLARYSFAGVGVSIGYTITVYLMVDQTGWLRPGWASAVSFLLWTPVSYVVHRDFTFRADKSDRSAAAKYLVSFLLRFAASALVVVIAIDYLHLHYLVGALMNWIVLPMINYFVLKLWVFAVPQIKHAHEFQVPVLQTSPGPRGGMVDN